MRGRVTERSTGRVVVLIALAFLTGFMLHAVASGRGDRPSTTEPAQSHPDSDSASSGDPADVGPGPVRVENGVPAGFARTEEGAVAAAAAFVTTGRTLLELDPLAAEDAIRQMASSTTADEQAEHLLGQLRGLRAVLAAGNGPVVYRQAVVAYRVESFDPDEARVAIWNVGVLSRSGIAPPQAGWATSTFDLVWERGDWRILRETVAPGPAPVLDDSAAPSTAEQLAAALEGFVDFGGDQ